MTIYLGTIRCVQDAYRRIATIFWRLCFYLPKHLGSLCRKSHGLYVDRDSVHAGLFDEGTRSQAKAGLDLEILMIPVSSRAVQSALAGELHFITSGGVANINANMAA